MLMVDFEDRPTSGINLYNLERTLAAQGIDPEFIDKKLTIGENLKAFGLSKGQAAKMWEGSEGEGVDIHKDLEAERKRTEDLERIADERREENLKLERQLREASENVKKAQEQAKQAGFVHAARAKREGQGGWFGESRRHSEVALKTDAAREARLRKEIAREFKVGLPKTIIPANRQVGHSIRVVDSGLPAMKPGKRISETGRHYYEYRQNRSDLRGRI